MPVSCAPPYRFYVWLPWVCLVSLLCLDVYQYGLRVTGFEPFLQIYLLGFGLLGYPLFALWASRRLHLAPRHLWWAPLWCVPFYALPWVLYGLVYLLTGRIAGLGLMLMWVAFVPYLLGAGYFFVTLTALLLAAQRRLCNGP
ncbi:hypothetical protein B8W70_03145 [Pseudomonas sp. 1239]|jgi:hypothetical protein|uniref:hypothetical protein n=1 Tax=Pseudomonas TaxID=286 RepID=UPI0009978729|nr:MULTISPECIES: hypothetical protein [Pseudomonas]OUM34990.1 hypothetical protein B8W70_03145 [Pseudomonas sp. 1239]WKL67155.1 hypothetical protein Q1Z72_00320 [Pseudomonas qingdaonensis]